MKRSLILLLAACTLVAITGCKRETVFTERLPSNPTTGYE